MAFYTSPATRNFHKLWNNSRLCNRRFLFEALYYGSSRDFNSCCSMGGSRRRLFRRNPPVLPRKWRRALYATTMGSQTFPPSRKSSSFRCPAPHGATYPRYPVPYRSWWSGSFAGRVWYWEDDNSTVFSKMV